MKIHLKHKVHHTQRSRTENSAHPTATQIGITGHEDTHMKLKIHHSHRSCFKGSAHLTEAQILQRHVKTHIENSRFSMRIAQTLQIQHCLLHHDDSLRHEESASASLKLGNSNTPYRGISSHNCFWKHTWNARFSIRNAHERKLLRTLVQHKVASLAMKIHFWN